MTQEFKEWFRQKVKEGSFHYARGIAEGYKKAVFDLTALILEKPISTGEALEILRHLNREATEMGEEALRRDETVS